MKKNFREDMKRLMIDKEWVQHNIADGTVIIPPNSQIKKEAFKGTDIQKVFFSNSKVNIGKEAFAECKSLTEVTCEGSIGTIGENAFRGCTALSLFRVCGAVNKIKPGAFRGCEKIQTVVLCGVGMVCEKAFAENKGLKNLVVGNYMKVASEQQSVIGPIKQGAFSGCPLSWVRVPDNGNPGHLYRHLTDTIDVKKIVVPNIWIMPVAVVSTVLLPPSFQGLKCFASSVVAAAWHVLQVGAYLPQELIEYILSYLNLDQTSERNGVYLTSMDKQSCLKELSANSKVQDIFKPPEEIVANSLFSHQNRQPRKRKAESNQKDISVFFKRKR